MPRLPSARQPPDRKKSSAFRLNGPKVADPTAQNSPWRRPGNAPGASIRKAKPGGACRGVSLQQEFDTTKSAKVCQHGIAGFDGVETGASPRRDDVAGLEAMAEPRLLVCKPHHHVHGIAECARPLALAAD